MACGAASTGEEHTAVDEEILDLNDEPELYESDLRLEAAALGKRSLNFLQLSNPEEDCDSMIALSKECAATLQKSQAFLEKIQERTVAINGAPIDAAASSLDIMLGETEDVEEGERPDYCIKTNMVLKKCHSQLYKVTAYIEKLGGNGKARPGYPGSDTPVTPEKKPADQKIVIIPGSTNDAIFENVTLTSAEQQAAEDICAKIEQEEVIADTDNYKKKDEFGFESELKQTTDTLINMHLQERVSFFASERQNKKLEFTPKIEELPKCQRCWMRRRRAGRSGEVNSCKPAPPPAPEPEEKPKEAPVPEKPTEDFDTDSAESEAAEPTKAKVVPAAASNETAAYPYSTESGPVGFVPGYTTPLRLQDRFFYGALTYQTKGAWSCDVKGGAAVTCGIGKGELPCELKGPKSAQECKAKCDACDGCVGFNFIRNLISEKDYNGGLCIFLDKNPESTPAMMAASTTCAAFSHKFVNNGTCAEPKSDPDFYCCSQGAYFQKRKKIEVKCLSCCESVDPARKCDGPQCENCAKNPIRLGTCEAARNCCRATPPCDDSTCSVCPDPVNDGAVKTTTINGDIVKYNIPQEAKVGPYPLEGYSTPAENQGFFFDGALNIKGGGEYTCGLATARVGSPTICTAKPHLSKLQDCKVYCDNEATCAGFNLIYNGFNVRETGSPDYDGGLCVFLNADPSERAIKKHVCAAWTGSKATCVAPGIDANMNCCSDGFYYRKLPVPPVCSATHPAGSKKLKCIFPFKYKGKSYDRCIKHNDANDGSAEPWCMTDTISGDWGNCEEASCVPTGKMYPKEVMAL